jgi:hypothetical protein
LEQWPKIVRWADSFDPNVRDAAGLLFAEISEGDDRSRGALASKRARKKDQGGKGNREKQRVERERERDAHTCTRALPSCQKSSNASFTSLPSFWRWCDGVLARGFGRVLGSEVCREALVEVVKNFKSLLRLNKMDPQVAQTVMG